MFAKSVLRFGPAVLLSISLPGLSGAAAITEFKVTTSTQEASEQWRNPACDRYLGKQIALRHKLNHTIRIRIKLGPKENFRGSVISTNPAVIPSFTVMANNRKFIPRTAIITRDFGFLP